MQRLKAKYKLNAYVLKTNESSQEMINPKGSCLGQVYMGLPGEEWPQYHGRPMLGLCQMNLQDIDFVPESLREIAMITVFVALGDDGCSIDTIHHGQETDIFCVRTYASSEIMVPYINQPSISANIYPRQAIPTPVNNYPPSYPDLNSTHQRNNGGDEITGRVGPGRRRLPGAYCS